VPRFCSRKVATIQKAYRCAAPVMDLFRIQAGF